MIQKKKTPKKQKTKLLSGLLRLACATRVPSGGNNSGSWWSCWSWWCWGSSCSRTSAWTGTSWRVGPAMCSPWRLQSGDKGNVHIVIGSIQVPRKANLLVWSPCINLISTFSICLYCISIRLKNHPVRAQKRLSNTCDNFPSLGAPMTIFFGDF